MSNDAKTRPGPVYDNAIKLLPLEHRLRLCRYLGIKTDETLESYSEQLAGRTLEVDMLQPLDEKRFAHLEFFRDAPADLGERMLEYLVRIWDRYSEIAVEQHVVILGRGTSSGTFARDSARLDYNVHILRHNDPAEILTDVGLSPLAVLAKARNERERVALLREALIRISQDTSPDALKLMESATALAGIYLPRKAVVDVMEELKLTFRLREIPWYRELLDQVEDAQHQREQLEQECDQLKKQRVLEQRRADEAERRVLTECLSDLMVDRFGDDKRIRTVAERLAGKPFHDARMAIKAAGSLNDLAGLS